MSAEAEDILDAALGLSANDRADLAARLFASLDVEVEEDVEQAWDREISERLADLDAGRVNLVPWSEARRQIRGER